jgi:hypothetical protein
MPLAAYEVVRSTKSSPVSVEVLTHFVSLAKDINMIKGYSPPKYHTAILVFASCFALPYHPLKLRPKNLCSFQDSAARAELEKS